ncbi:MAG TPA: YkgJ family cysteine cluster protein [Chloroflexia bacterium]|nr:YkgJ family cysteine cluster protein [Chloroflexia bacterium]
MAELHVSMAGRESEDAFLIGTCSQCGVCCERILLVEPDPETGGERDASTSDDPDIVDIRQHLVVAYRRPDGVPVWRCRNLRWYDGKASCGIYDSRPHICRAFPLSNVGDLPDRCSYRFVRKERLVAPLMVSSVPLREVSKVSQFCETIDSSILYSYN